MKSYTEQQVLGWLVHLAKIGRIKVTGDYTASDLMEWLPEPTEVSEEELREAFDAGKKYEVEEMKEFYSQGDEYFSSAPNFNKWMQNRLKQ